jgi:RNA polymerase sigma-70 factor (ECF subfamily)
MQCSWSALRFSTTKNSTGCQLSTHVNLVNTPIPNHNNIAIGECLSAWDDDLLVSAAKAGDRSAFVELYERHSRKVLPRIYRITKNREDAEDAFQDAVLRAFAHMKGFEGRSNFTSWLTRIAINSALMILRKRRGAEISIEQISDDSDNHRAWEPSDHSETPEGYCARRESEELLRNAIQRLPCIFRDALELQRSREYSTSQVAEELGISVSAAKARLMRARRTMRRRLSGTRPRNASNGRPKMPPPR